MLKTSFLEMIRTFDKEELKRFEAFINSPYFNSRSYVINLFKLIKEHSPGFNDTKIEKEKLWKEMFPDKNYNYGVMKNIIYDITKLAERFMEVEIFNLDEKARMNCLLEKLSQKHLDTIFLNKYNAFEKSKYKSSKFYESIYEDLVPFTVKRFNLGAYNTKTRVKFISSSIAKLFILEFIVKFAPNLNNIYIEKTDFNEIPEDDFVNVFSNMLINSGIEKCAESLKSDRDMRIFLIYLKIIKCYMNPEKIRHYFELKDTLCKTDRYISESTVRGLYACLGSVLDNCKDTVNVNKNSELLKLMHILVDKKIFAEDNGIVSPSLFMLAVKTAAYEKDSKFIEKIQKEYLHKTDRSHQENLKHFAAAYLHYSKKEYDDSLSCIGKVSIDSFPMKYALKNLQILISFEKDDYDMFLYLQDSQKHFLSNNKSVSVSYKISNMKFLNFLNTLFKLRQTKDKIKLDYLEKSILGDRMVNKYWLLEKIKESAGKI